MPRDRPLDRVTCGYHLCRQDLHRNCALRCHREPGCKAVFCVEHRGEHWCGVTEPDRPEEVTVSGMEGGVSASQEVVLEDECTTSSSSEEEEGEYRRSRVRTYDPTTGSDANSPYAHPSKRVRASFDPTTGSDSNSPFAHAAREEQRAPSDGTALPREGLRLPEEVYEAMINRIRAGPPPFAPPERRTERGRSSQPEFRRGERGGTEEEPSLQDGVAQLIRHQSGDGGGTAIPALSGTRATAEEKEIQGDKEKALYVKVSCQESNRLRKYRKRFAGCVAKLEMKFNGHSSPGSRNLLGQLLSWGVPSARRCAGRSH